MDERSLRKTSDAEKYWTKDIQSMSLLGNECIELFFRDETVLTKISSPNPLLERIIVS